MIRDLQTRALGRRDWLRAVGGAFAAFPALAADAGLKAKAKKNLKLAIFGLVYAGLPVEEAARQMKADGFSGVIHNFVFADVRFDPLAPDWAAAEKIMDCFARQGIKTAGLSAYYNVVDPEAARREKGEKQMQFYIANWKRLGSPFICTETGTLNPKSEWLESPENATEEAYVHCCANLMKLVKAAEKTGAVIAIEPYWRNVIDSPVRAERLFREVNSPSLKLVMDPCNYFRQADLGQMQPMLEEIFRRVGQQTVLTHAKDVKPAPEGPDLPAAGLGVLDYPLYLRLLAGLNSELYLAIEHLTMEDVPRARDYVLSQFERV